MRAPTRRSIGRARQPDRHERARRPPAPRAAGPGPTAPTCRMSLAKIGSSAVAPPSSTANRSSEIAPSTTGRCRMKRTPANTVVQRHRLLGRAACAWRSVANSAPATAKSTRAGGVHHRGAGHVEEAAERRPADDRDLHARRAEGQRARQQLVGGTSSGDDRLLRRHLEGAWPRRAAPTARGAARGSTQPCSGGRSEQRRDDRLHRQAQRPARGARSSGRPRGRRPAPAPAPAGTAAGRPGRGPRRCRSGRTSASRARPSASGWRWCRPGAPTTGA